MTELTCIEDRQGRLYTAWKDGRVIGYLAVDSLVGGRCCGGVRMLPRLDAVEMRALARAMSLKYGLLGLPQGGAKAGVIGDPEADRADRRRLLGEFAEALAPLLAGGVFAPCPDVGTDAEDIRHLLETVGAPIGARQLRESSSGYYTALSVLASAREAMRAVGGQLAGCTAAVEGFGKVGSAAAWLLQRSGARVTAISTSRGAIRDDGGLPVGTLLELVRQFGSRVVEAFPRAGRIHPQALLELPVDLLCPCGVGGSVQAENAERISAKVLCPGANQLLPEEAEAALARRGVLSMPDFLANCGGVLGGTMEFACVRKDTIERFILRHLGALAGGILTRARRTGRSPRAEAEALALRRLDQVRRRAARPSRLGRLFRVGIALHGRGLLPGRLVGILAPTYFRRQLRTALRAATRE